MGKRKRVPLPWFRFNIGDWLMSETRAAMDLEHQGAYLNYLVIHYRDGSIPADPATRAKLLRIRPDRERRLWATIGSLFHPDPYDSTRLVNDRCLAEMARGDAFCDEQSDHGKLGGRPVNHEKNSRQKGETIDRFKARTMPANFEISPEKSEISLEKSPLSQSYAVRSPLFPVKQESQSESESDKEEEKTHPSDLSKKAMAHEEPSLSRFDSTDDRPTANAGFPNRWEPTEAEAASLANLMATHTGKRDPSFAAGILHLAAEGSANSFSEVGDCVRDAAAHTKEPIRTNAYFRTSVCERFSPGAPIIGPVTIKAAAAALRMTRAASEADREAQRERNRKQTAERLAKAANGSDPKYLEWMRKNEFPGEAVQLAHKTRVN